MYDVQHDFCSHLINVYNVEKHGGSMGNLAPSASLSIPCCGEVIRIVTTNPY